MTETRGERKERTRRAILDAALDARRGHSLAALSLRQVAKEVGIVPTAFYRHFDSIEALGLALVDESFVIAPARCCATYAAATRPSATSSTARSRPGRPRAPASGALPVHRARAQRAGHPPSAPRSATSIELFEHELATDLARLPGTDAWSAEDLRILSNLIVTAMVGTAEAILSAGPKAEAQVTANARKQLRMVLVGAVNWQSSRG